MIWVCSWGLIPHCVHVVPPLERACQLLYWQNSLPLHSLCKTVKSCQLVLSFQHLGGHHWFPCQWYRTEEVLKEIEELLKLALLLRVDLSLIMSMSTSISILGGTWAIEKGKVINAEWKDVYSLILLWVLPHKMEVREKEVMDHVVFYWICPKEKIT